MFRFDESATLSKIRVPTFVIVSKSYIVTRPFASDRINKKIPQAELKVLSPRGHMILMERNQQFVDIFREFSDTCLSLRK